MEFKELRIGNYLMFKGKPTKVCGITEDACQIYETRDKKFYPSKFLLTSNGNLIPIKLTDKILIDNYFGYQDGDSKEHGSWWFGNDFKLDVTEEGEYQYNGKCYIKYVHQLQNLFSVLGIDDNLIIKE